MLRLDLYEVLGIKPYRLKVDPENLEKKFYELSRRWHPDRNPGNLDAIEISAQINEAYRRLREPWQRAEYVIEALGEKLGSKVPPRLASIFFQLQEAETQEALQGCELQLINLLEELDSALERAFEAWDKVEAQTWSSSGFKSEREGLVNLILERSYTKTMLQDIKSRLSQKN